MRRLLILMVFSSLGLSCAKEVRTKFSDEVLAQEYLSLNDRTTTFKDILKQYPGKQIVIVVWASWCRDCIIGFPKLKALQTEYPEAVFLFLSADRSKDSWKRAIEKYQLEGEHYFLPNGTKGVLGDFVDIDWIPRYMIVDSEGHIELFEAIVADDPQLRNTLK